jgi:hypothetical protein
MNTPGTNDGRAASFETRALEHDPVLAIAVDGGRSQLGAESGIELVRTVCGHLGAALPLLPARGDRRRCWGRPSGSTADPRPVAFTTISKAALSRPLAMLSPVKLRAINRALRFALGLD